MMASRVLRVLQALELEEQILNAGAVFGIIGVFLPWLSGEWFTVESATFSGFGFYTSFVGISIFLLHLFILAITLVPIFGGPVIVNKRNKEVIRFCAAGGATILILAALSVLMEITFDFSRLQVRFGIYISLIGSLIATLYTFLAVQEQRKQQVQELFHHPEDQRLLNEKKASFTAPPPPPPPPAPAPEEHRLYP